MKTLHILVIDDNAVTAMRLVNDLPDHCIALEPDLSFALTRMRSHEAFDVVVCRPRMLERPGGPMLATLCSLPDAPVLVLTDDCLGSRVVELIRRAQDKHCSAVTRPLPRISAPANP